MFCGECGTRNPDTNQFCKNCGKPLGRIQAAARSPVPPAAQPVPASYPAAQPAPSLPYQQTAAPAIPVTVPVPGIQKRQWNWPGIVSIPLGILSWGILPLILASGAILLGLAGLVIFKRATGRIGISSIIGIILGFAAVIVFIVLG